MPHLDLNEAMMICLSSNAHEWLFPPVYHNPNNAPCSLNVQQTKRRQNVDPSVDQTGGNVVESWETQRMKS